MTSRIAALFVLSLACFGCDTVCDAADEKAELCGVPWGGEGRDDCSGQVECIATCVDDLTCKDILNEEPDSTYLACRAQCPPD
jgi:hypothetical protein